MKKCREMTPDIFRSNLLSALAEIDIGSNEPLFRIIRVEKKDACSDNYGRVFDMVVLSEHNIKDKLLSLDEVVSLLSGLSPYVPTQNLKVCLAFLIEPKKKTKIFRMQKWKFET